MEQLANQLAVITQDYADGNIMTPNRVLSWVEQFDIDDQIPILREMIHILSKTYISHEGIREFIKSLLGENEIFDPSHPHDTLFLRIQTKGRSQHELLDIVEDVLDNEYSLDISNCGTNPSKYVYIDDGLYTGNRMYRDLEAHVPDNVTPNSQLHIVFLGMHTSGHWYNSKRLEELCEKNKIRITFWRQLELDNFNNPKAKSYDCCWPQEMATANVHLNSYLETQDSSKIKVLYRPNWLNKSKIFSQTDDRAVLERAFLEKGAYIASLPAERQTNMRPLGYSLFDGLGFGAMLVVARNISNNCPLVLWWGNPEANAEHPFSKWLPLFPRKSNEETRVLDWNFDFDTAW